MCQIITTSNNQSRSLVQSAMLLSCTSSQVTDIYGDQFITFFKFNANESNVITELTLPSCFAPPNTSTSSTS